MDLNQLKKIMEKVKGKVIIVENGEPILIISSFEEEQQQLSLQPSVVFKNEGVDPSPLVKGDRVDRKEKKRQDVTEEEPKIIQGTDLLTKEEMPADELTIEDLPF